MKILTALLIATLGASLYAQQTPPQGPPKPTPRTADGHPDLSGVWVAGNPDARQIRVAIGRARRRLGWTLRRRLLCVQRRAERGDQKRGEYLHRCTLRDSDRRGRRATPRSCGRRRR